MIDIPSLWRTFLHERVMLQQHQVLATPPMRNPVIDRLVPSLLLIKGTSILHQALREEISARNLATPKKYHSTLEEDINLLAQCGSLADEKTALHSVRARRLDAAHGTEHMLTWTELEADIATIERALHRLGLVSPRPALDIYYGRSRVKDSPDQNIVMVLRHRFGVTENGQLTDYFEWESHVHRMTPLTAQTTDTTTQEPESKA